MSGPRRASAIAIPDAPPTRGANRAAIRSRSSANSSKRRSGRPQRAEKRGASRSTAQMIRTSESSRQSTRANFDLRRRSASVAPRASIAAPQHVPASTGSSRAMVVANTVAGRSFGRARPGAWSMAGIGRLAEEESINDRRDKEPADDRPIPSSSGSFAAPGISRMRSTTCTPVPD